MRPKQGREKQLLIIIMEGCLLSRLSARMPHLTAHSIRGARLGDAQRRWELARLPVFAARGWGGARAGAFWRPAGDDAAACREGTGAVRARRRCLLGSKQTRSGSAGGRGRARKLLWAPLSGAAGAAHRTCQLGWRRVPWEPGAVAAAGRGGRPVARLPLMGGQASRDGRC